MRAAPVSYLDINFLDMRALQGNEVWFDCNGLDIEDTFDTYRVTNVKLAKSAVVGTTGVFKLLLQVLAVLTWVLTMRQRLMKQPLLLSM